MDKNYIIIDNRMRNIEKECLTSLWYRLIEFPNRNNVYEEISSNADIFISKIGNSIIIEPSIYELLVSKISNYEESEFLQGDVLVKYNYPFDIPYNICIRWRPTWNRENNRI